MKLKITSKNIGYLGLMIWILFCLGGLILDYVSPPYVPLDIKIENPTTCKTVNGKWLTDETFKVGQVVYICANIKSNVSDLHTQIDIRVYENEVQSMAKAIFYDMVWVSNGESRILVDNYFFPGKYVIQISNGRKTLAMVEFNVVDK